MVIKKEMVLKMINFYKIYSVLISLVDDNKYENNGLLLFLDDASVNSLLNKNIDMDISEFENLMLKSFILYDRIKNKNFRLTDNSIKLMKEIIDITKMDEIFGDNILNEAVEAFPDGIYTNKFIKLFDEFILEINFKDDNLNIIKLNIQKDKNKEKIKMLENEIENLIKDEKYEEIINIKNQIRTLADELNVI
jgi:hypothetical protein